MRRHPLLLLLSILTASAAWADAPQHESSIHPPKWAIGVWETLAENNSWRIVTLQVSNDAIRISRGLGAKKMDPLAQYRGWTIKENTAGGLYRIEFSKQGRTELFELKLHRSDPGSHSPRALTLYTGRAPAPAAAHSDSINLLLMNLDDSPDFAADRRRFEEQPTRE